MTRKEAEMSGRCPICGNEHIEKGFIFLGGDSWECCECHFVGTSKDYGMH